VGTKGRSKVLVKYVGPTTGDSRENALEALIDEVEKLTKCDDYPGDDKLASGEDSDDDEDDSDSPPRFFSSKTGNGMGSQSNGGFDGHGKLISDAPSHGGQNESMERNNVNDHKNDRCHIKRHRSNGGHIDMYVKTGPLVLFSMKNRMSHADSERHITQLNPLWPLD
jgi:hypothetical protein